MGSEVQGKQPAAPRRLAEGERFAGRYVVERALGEGGMGAVYLVRDELLQERVALKLALSGVRDREPTLRREASLARRVTHPGVARVFDLGVHDDVFYLTMEYVPGRSLRRRIRAGALSADEVATLGAQIASALAAAHDAAVVHLDLKPENVVIAEGAVPRAVLVDFGISRRFGERNDGTGTLDYMAPEQLNDGALGGAVDVYALGLLLFELATGERAFGGAPAELLRRLTEKPPLLTEVPAPLASLIDACVEPRPAERPTMRIVENTLARQLRGASLSSSPSPSSSSASTPLPTAVGLRLARARAVLAVGRDELRVVDELEEIIAHHPTLDVAIAVHALALVRAWNNALASDDIADRAVAAVSRAIALAPHLADTHVADALVAAAGGDLAYAVRALRRGLARDPLHAFSHEILGLLEVEAGVADCQRLRLAHALDAAQRAGLAHVAREKMFAGEDAIALDLLDEIDADGRTCESNLLRMRHAIWHRDGTRARELAGALADDATPVGTSIRLVCEAIAGQADLKAMRGLLETLLRLPITPLRRAYMHMVFVEIAVASDVDVAAEHLLHCAQLPLGDLRWLETCPVLEPLRDRPEFVVARAAVKARCDAAFGRTADPVAANTADGVADDRTTLVQGPPTMPS